MNNLPFSNARPFGLSLIALTFALAACTPKAGTEASPSLAAIDSSESALPPLPDVQPMVAGPAAPVRRAPAAAALPKARTLGYASAPAADRYAWIDRANRINETIGDAPPDYGFDYQNGVQPYGWDSAGGYRTYAEPVDGGYRTYYYDPGANEPYLVRDPNYSYGYSGGRIVTVYDRGGRALDGDQAQRQADYASRYYDRGRAMRSAADSRQRRGVAASGWAEQRPVISTQRAEWNRTQTNTPEWRAYRDDHAVEDQRLADERTARAQAARQFSTWQSQGFRGQTPQMYDQPQGVRRDGNGYGQRDQMQQRQGVQQQQAAQQRALQLGQEQATRDAQAKARDLALRQQQGAAQQAKLVQQRDAMTQAKAAQVSQQQAVKVRAQQQRVAAQAERLRVARQSQVAAKQKRIVAGTERLRVAREQQVAAKQQAVQQRATVQRQREVDTAKRVAVTRQNAANAAQARKAAQETAAIVRKTAAKPVVPVAKPKPPEPRKPAVQPRPGANPG